MDTDLWCLTHCGAKANGANDYQYTEATLLTGAAFYRIKQTGTNSVAASSAIVKLSTPARDVVPSLSPNPAKEAVVITVPL